MATMNWLQRKIVPMRASGRPEEAREGEGGRGGKSDSGGKVSLTVVVSPYFSLCPRLPTLCSSLALPSLFPRLHCCCGGLPSPLYNIKEPDKRGIPKWNTRQGTLPMISILGTRLQAVSATNVAGGEGHRSIQRRRSTYGTDALCCWRRGGEGGASAWLGRWRNIILPISITIFQG